MAMQPPRPSPSRPSDGAVSRPPVGFHGAVSEFKRRLIEATLCQWGGNRTRTARALGLQRTYLLRLMREFGVHVPRADGGVGTRGGNGRPAATESHPSRAQGR